MNRREGRPLGATYVSCDVCGTLFIRDQPRPDELAAAYGDSSIDLVSFDPAHPPSPISRDIHGLTHMRRALRTMSRRLQGRPHSWPEETGHGRRILDFGCGGGAKLVDFYQRGWRVSGIDLNVAGIARAQSLMPDGEWYAGQLETAPPWAPFEVIRTDNVVEHLPDPLTALSLLRSRLAPGGHLICYVPHGRSLSVRLLGDRSISVWVPYHLQLFSRRGLELLLRRAGFDEIEIGLYSPLDWWPLTFRQAVRTPGFVTRPRHGIDGFATAAARALTPVWLLSNHLGLGEELVARATG